jgi:hypothetical protein
MNEDLNNDFGFWSVSSDYYTSANVIFAAAVSSQYLQMNTR